MNGKQVDVGHDILDNIIESECFGYFENNSSSESEEEGGIMIEIYEENQIIS